MYIKINSNLIKKIVIVINILYNTIFLYILYISLLILQIIVYWRIMEDFS